LGTR
jgi:hypothetical protein